MLATLKDKGFSCIAVFTPCDSYDSCDGYLSYTWTSVISVISVMSVIYLQRYQSVLCRPSGAVLNVFRVQNFIIETAQHSCEYDG